MSAKSRFLNSVSGIALTAALATLAVPALAETQSQAGITGPGTNQNSTGQTLASVEAENGLDPQNQVEVTGLVTSAFGIDEHLNSIGIFINGWDIEASNATDFTIGPAGSALAENKAIVRGSITGLPLNLDYAPGTGSYGVRVADDIQAKNALAGTSDSGDGTANPYNVAVTAIARNVIDATGGVQGSAIDSFGVRVDGNVEATFATSRITVDNYFGATNIATGYGRALNIVGVSGAVGGEGASDGSVGFYVGGSIFASDSVVDGNAFVVFGSFSGPAAQIYTTGVASLDILASNTVAVTGAIAGVGGLDAVGVYVGDDVFATRAAAAGSALSDGGQEEISRATSLVVAENGVSITGSVVGSSGPATGVYIVGDVYASEAGAFSHAAGRYASFYEEIGGSLTAGSATAIARNTVVIAGVVSSEGGVGVSIGEAAFAAEGTALADADANSSDYANEFNSAATALAQTSNSVVVVGTALANDATGVAIAGPVYAQFAEANGGSTAYANFTTGTAVAVAAASTVTSSAQNSVVIIGTVADSLSNSAGVDPLYIQSAYADAYGSAYADVQSTAGFDATSNVSNSVAASNVVGLVATLGNSVTNSTGVEVDQSVRAFDADATGYSSGYAASTISDTVSNADTTALVVNTVSAGNLITIAANLGDGVGSSTGVYIGGSVLATNADAFGRSYAEATVTGGAAFDAIATSSGTVNAGNSAAIAAALGPNSAQSTGIYVGGEGGIVASNAFAEGSSGAYAESLDNQGLAIAVGVGSVGAINLASVSGSLGTLASGSTGVSSEEEVSATQAFGEGTASAGALVSSLTLTPGASATATAINGVLAANGTSILGVVGAGSSVGIGVRVGDYVEAYDAWATGSAEASATIYGGVVGSAIATASNDIDAVNQLNIAGTVGATVSGSTGIWVGDGVYATDADADGSASAYGGVFSTAGIALANVSNAVAASNLISAAGTVGAESTESVGVHIGEGVLAADAQALGTLYANAEVVDGQSGAIGLAAGTLAISAINAVSLNGSVGTLGNVSTGIRIDNTTVTWLPYGPEPVVIGAVSAFAEGSATVIVTVAGGTGTTTASEAVSVTAVNQVALAGTASAGSNTSAGISASNGPVIAGDAWASGDGSASATKSGGTGDASASLSGGVAAQNVVTIVGAVGDAAYMSRGVDIVDGSVVATFAEGFGNFAATATRNGPEAGNAVATIGTSIAPSAVVAGNGITIVGTVSGLALEGTGADGNIGAVIGEGVYATTAFAEGNFNAAANRIEAGAGSATATIYGAVLAANAISLTGTVTAGDSLGDVGNSLNGVRVAGNVQASEADAEGSASASANRNGTGTIGNATAFAALGVTAANAVAIVGGVESYNSASTGIVIGGGVGAGMAFAEGIASTQASNNDDTDGDAISAATLAVNATNGIAVAGTIGNDVINGATGVSIGEGIGASYASAQGTVTSVAARDGAGDGTATAAAAGAVTASNIVDITGALSANLYGNSANIGVFISEGVTAGSATATGAANASASHTGAGTGVATATASIAVVALNAIQIVGTVGSGSQNGFGVDPLFLTASDATSNSSATITVNGPTGSTGVANAAAVAVNSASISGVVTGNPTLSTNGSTGVEIVTDVTAQNASATASNIAVIDGAAAAIGVATATAINQITISGAVGQNGASNTGVDIGGNLFTGGLHIGLTTEATISGNAATATFVGAGSMVNQVLLAGSVANDMQQSQGVRIGGGIEFGGLNSHTLTQSFNVPGTSAVSALQVLEGRNIGGISGTVGTNATGSQGVSIGGNIAATNDLVTNLVVFGADGTNDGTTRGVYIGGSILTGDAEDSQRATQQAGINTTAPVIPDPVQIGDYVQLGGSVFIGANGGTNLFGVAVGDGNDTVLVHDTHFQMEVVNGFDGGANPDVDGQDVITFNNAQIFVSNIDNFEKLNVTNRSALILANPTPYTYTVRDEVNIDYNGILSFGDGGAPPPPPIAAGSPVNSALLVTNILTIGGIAGVKTPGPGIDDSILKAENNGTGTYQIDGSVFNFGTITLSKVLSAIRGTDPHDLTGTSASSFDTLAEQQFWAITGAWALDPTSAAGDRLTINGSYTAGSDLILDAFVFKTGSASDVAVYTNTVAGLTTIWVNNTNAFGAGALTGRGPTDGVLLVDVNNGQDPAAVGAAFKLGNTSAWNWLDPINHPEPELQVGAFVYDLEQGGGDGRNFYLQSQLLDQVPAYTVMSSAIQQHFAAELGTLYQRMGELRHADTGSKANSSFFEFWMRAYGQDVEMKPKEGFDFDMTSKGFMIGGDYAIRNWIAPQSRLHIGGFGGYGWTKLDNIKGDTPGESDGKTDGYTLGLYATYFDTAKKGQGLYVDAVAKVNFLDSEYSSSTRDTSAKSDDFAWGVSLETGYGFGLGGGFIVQPQGQLSYMRTSKEKIKENSPGIPLDIERDSTESLRGRLGLQLQNTFMLGSSTQFSPYIIGNVLHEFMGDNRTTVAGTEFRNDMGGTWYNAGAGFSLDFDNVGLYGHVEYNFGSRVEGLAAGLGVKVRLGGSSPVAAAAPAPAPAPAMVPKKNFLVFFDFDRSNITADAQRVIDEAASTAKAGNSTRVQLTGHTDRSGTEQYNMALSMRRGEAVKQALIARGIPANSIAIIARGENQPLVPTADGVREPQNRRVEILL